MVARDGLQWAVVRGPRRGLADGLTVRRERVWRRVHMRAVEGHADVPGRRAYDGV